MGIYKNIYDFAAKAGALEGYVYPREKVDPKYLLPWTNNLLNEYNGLSPEVKEEIQVLCNETIGRAIRSLLPLLGEDHEVIKKLRTLVKGWMPTSPDDFPHNR